MMNLCTFTTNDGKRRVWVKDQPPFRQKGRGEGVIASGFLTPGGRLQIPEHITNAILCNLALYPQWPRTQDA